MTWLWVVLVLVVLGSTAAVAVGRGGAMARAYPDRREVRLPADRPVGASDLDDVRFSVVLRGYRMDEVDDVISRIGRDLAEREARVAVREREVAEREHRPDDPVDRADSVDRGEVGPVDRGEVGPVDRGEPAGQPAQATDEPANDQGER